GAGGGPLRTPARRGRYGPQGKPPLSAAAASAPQTTIRAEMMRLPCIVPPRSWLRPQIRAGCRLTEVSTRDLTFSDIARRWGVDGWGTAGEDGRVDGGLLDQLGDDRPAAEAS